MTFFSAARDPLTRQTVDPKNNNATVVHNGSSKICDIVQLLDGGGTELVRAKVIERFAQKITRDDTPEIELTDATVTGESFRAKQDQATTAAINAGLHTVASTMLFNRIVEIRASLFANGSKYVYDPEGDYVADLDSARGLASHDLNMGRLDMLATGIGSAGMLVQADVTGYSYQPFDPTKIWVVYGDILEVGGSKIPVSHTNIEHASIVVLEVGGSSSAIDKRNYVAYFARQEDWAKGRLVRYEANEWKDIPDPGEGGFDWVDSDEWLKFPERDRIANPLTVYQDSSSALYEYPLLTWHMDQTAYGTTLLPVTGTALYDQVFELDVEMSRIIEAGGRSAAGTWVLNNEKGSQIHGVWNEGMVIANREQTVSLLSHPASNAKDALLIIDKVAERTASRYHVPGYMVATTETFQVPSGIALQVMNQPLLQDRQQRFEVNQSSMARKFEIEKELGNFTQGQDVVPVDATERWAPNPLEFPEDGNALSAMVPWHEFLLKNNMSTIEDLLIEMGKVDTIEAAKNLTEQNTKTNKGRQPEPPQPQGRGGALGRTFGRGAQ
jgi:hypothetical protein